MTITPALWNTLTNILSRIADCPLWLAEQAKLSWEVMSQLPEVDETAIGQHAIPRTEEKTIKQDYIDFLREQIRLNARGRDWSTILMHRLNALEPFVGKRLIVTTFYSKPHSATLRIRTDSAELVHFETTP
jgi:hypothetical protein